MDTIEHASDGGRGTGSPEADHGDGIAAKEFFETLVENGSDAIITIDESSTILYANQSVERVFGYEPGELVGSDLTKVIPERLRQSHYDALEEYIETSERNLDWSNVEIPGEHKDGHEVHLSVTFEEHPLQEKRVFSGIIRDVSARVERERQLEQQNEQLERFASIVSHDLRDPLNAANARVALASATADGETAEYLEEIAEIHDRMGALVDDVLTLTKEGESVGETSTVAVEAVAEEAWTTAASADATLDVDSGVTVRADPDRLRTVFENLVGNAMRHAGEDATVTIGPLDGGNGFYVADDGPGIPKEEREHVFDYGYTNAEDGTGFGLNIVESIADAHGWRLEVTESESGGARFEFHCSTEGM